MRTRPGASRLGRTTGSQPLVRVGFRSGVRLSSLAARSCSGACALRLLPTLNRPAVFLGLVCGAGPLARLSCGAGPDARSPRSRRSLIGAPLWCAIRSLPLACSVPLRVMLPVSRCLPTPHLIIWHLRAQMRSALTGPAPLVIPEGVPSVAVSRCNYQQAQGIPTSAPCQPSAVRVCGYYCWSSGRSIATTSVVAAPDLVNWRQHKGSGARRAAVFDRREIV